MVAQFQRGDSTFHQLDDGTYVEHDEAAGWTGVSRYQHGLATGRPSPAPAMRPRAITSVLAGEGMLPSHGGPGQGMLFTPETRSVGETLAAHGVPERRSSSGEGFLPRLGSVAGAAGPAERDAVAQEKARAIRVAGAITAHSAPGQGADPTTFGTPTPMRRQMENRARHIDPNTTGNWYDHEAEEVETLASKHGVPHSNMRRAVASLSPQKPWVYGSLQDDNLHYPNLEAADAVARTVISGRKDAASRGEDFDAGKYAAEHTTVPSMGTPGLEVKPQTMGNMAKAGAAFGEGYDPSARMVNPAEGKVGKSGKPLKSSLAPVGEKVPNFDLALAAGHDSPTVRREAAQAYTSDTWDVRSAGIPHYSFIGGGGMMGGKPEGWPKGADSNPRGQYDVVAMTGRRAGLKAGMAPSEMQQHVWRVGKGVGVGSGSTDSEQQMFPGDKNGRRERHTPLDPNTRIPRKGEFDNSEFLKRMDEEKF